MTPTLPQELIEEMKEKFKIFEEWLYPNADSIEYFTIEFMSLAYQAGLKDGKEGRV